MKTKTASVRLPKEMYEEIDNICDGIGCSRNDWIKDTLQDKLREESNENNQDQEQNIPEPELITTPKPTLEPISEEIPEMTEANVVLEPEDNSKELPIQMAYFGNKLLPFAKRYNI